ncbi:hypothetical protein LJB87_01250, partial [Alistipes sp. OttesenSCG-928-L06]|nr:hypothetical protein [Alistipes sp. OttesenSCG-928-L06]
TPPTPQQTPAPVQAAAPAQQPAVQQAAPAQQQAAAPVEQPVMAAPAPQPQAQPVQGIQPNTEVFGMFSQQQAPVQQQAAPVQSPAPAQTAAPASGFDAMPFIQHELDVPACRDNEYEDIPDFPVEMAPPVYSGMQSQY